VFHYRTGQEFKHFISNAAAKYQFFDAAFGHVSNSSEFTALGSEIKDEYYSKRFKALIGE
jgi:hypothetical protein